MDCPEKGGHNHKDNNEASVAQQWWVDSHIQPMSEGLWDIRTQWHSVTFNLGGCQNALTLFFGASLAAASDMATGALIGWSDSGTGLSRCSCQTWLTAVAPEITFNTVPLTSCMPSLTPHLMFLCSFTKSIWQNWQTGASPQTWLCQTVGVEVWSSGTACVVVYKK